MTSLAPEAQQGLAAEIAAAGGREVSFIGVVDRDNVITDVRAVARGTADCVLALPGVASRGEIALHNHPTGLLEPSRADLDVAARLYEAGIGFGIVNNDASSLYVVAEVPRIADNDRLDPVAVADFLDEGGRVASVLGQFEDRPSQRDMAAYVADLYNDGGVSLLEAGTGVGKSFAYLTPALLWAKANGERTIVSTNTINLQEQLVGKDLPILSKAFADDDFQPTFALLKGWSNYICISRLRLAAAGQASLLEPERQQELRDLTGWAESSNDGSLADLTDQPSPEVWDEVSAAADLCTRLECPHFDECFVFRARRRAAEADVVVVNHHLLAADLSVRRAQDNWQDAAVLPPYRRLILDEAHHIEDTAAQHLGAQVTSRGLSRVLGRLERNGRGLIPTMAAELRGSRADTDVGSLEICNTVLLRETSRAHQLATRVFAQLADFLMRRGEDVVRLEESFATDPIWEAGLASSLDEFVGSLRKLADGVEALVDRLELDEDGERRSQLVQELRGVVRRLQGASDALLLGLRPQRDSALVRWVERRGQRPSGGLPFPMALAAVPLNLAPILKESLFDRVPTVVLTSATLSTGGDFSFLKHRLGLDIAPVHVRDEEVLPSPFDFAEQCLLLMPSDLPDPRADSHAHDEAMAKAITQMAHLSDGGMFVLFTSYAALRRVAAAVRGTISSRWPLLIQGEGQRDHLLRRFREAGSAVLLGTDSFWEGVDVPGRSLRVLLLAKVPFKVPSEPLTAARLEALAAQGQDGFRHYLLPLAALKLKQGFGRLIRTKSDVGIVALMDPRVTTRNYGSVLVGSLPPAERSAGQWDDVMTAAEDFFARHGIGAPV